MRTVSMCLFACFHGLCTKPETRGDRGTPELQIRCRPIVVCGNLVRQKTLPERAPEIQISITHIWCRTATRLSGVLVRPNLLYRLVRFGRWQYIDAIYSQSSSTRGNWRWSAVRFVVCLIFRILTWAPTPGKTGSDEGACLCFLRCVLDGLCTKPDTRDDLGCDPALLPGEVWPICQNMDAANRICLPDGQWVRCAVYQYPSQTLHIYVNSIVNRFAIFGWVIFALQLPPLDLSLPPIPLYCAPCF